jgi:hypothetical protein
MKYKLGYNKSSIILRVHSREYNIYNYYNTLGAVLFQLFGNFMHYFTPFFQQTAFFSVEDRESLYV